MSRRELFEHAFPVPAHVSFSNGRYHCNEDCDTRSVLATAYVAVMYDLKWQGFCKAMDLMDNRHVEWSDVVEIASRWIKRKIKRGAK